MKITFINKYLMGKIRIFTDGSSLNNNTKDNRSGGIGVFFCNYLKISKSK